MAIRRPTIFVCLCGIVVTVAFIVGMIWAFRDTTVCDGGPGRRFCWDEFDNIPLTIGENQTGSLTGGTDIEYEATTMQWVAVYVEGKGCRPGITLMSQDRVRTSDLRTFGGWCYPFLPDPHLAPINNSCLFNFTGIDLDLHNIGADRSLFFRNVGKCDVEIYYVRQRYLRFDFIDSLDKHLIVGGICVGWYVCMICWIVCMKVARQTDNAPAWERQWARTRNDVSIPMNEIN
eukprot:TRINITY_DN7945_c0_g1_i1.p1 TRINITY_DN7945_c0_g1~~TRINITY_DN7945_c0_g1_i1.p1  ORF type:complete len:232 (+),score=28.83 TRINITY_DN7945_c0_g1_i1:54-749(+)